MQQYLSTLSLLACLASSCAKPADPQPTASQLIAGTYTAISTLSFSQPRIYPIDGRTMTFQVQPVSADTVQVRLQAPPNGLYSPAKDTTYAKVYVVTTPQGHTLTLEKPTHNAYGENQISFSTEAAFYSYVPPGYTLGAKSVVFNKVAP